MRIDASRIRLRGEEGTFMFSGIDVDCGGIGRRKDECPHFQPAFIITARTGTRVNGDSAHLPAEPGAGALNGS